MCNISYSLALTVTPSYTFNTDTRCSSIAYMWFVLTALSSALYKNHRGGGTVWLLTLSSLLMWCLSALFLLCVFDSLFCVWLSAALRQNGRYNNNFVLLTFLERFMLNLSLTSTSEFSTMTSVELYTLPFSKVFALQLSMSLLLLLRMGIYMISVWC